MISQTAEYALRAVVCLANEKDMPMTTKTLADVTKVSPSYLSKVMQSLVRAGLVKSQRGLHGGFVLGRGVSNLTVLDVINAVDPLQRIHSCPLELEAHGTNLCPLHRKLDDAIAHIEHVFSTHSIADLLTDPATSSPMGLCTAGDSRHSAK